MSYSYLVTDGFLPTNIFDSIAEVLYSNEFPWYRNDGSANRYDGTTLFSHVLYNDGKPNSAYFNLLDPILKGLNSCSLVRAKINLNTQSSEIIPSGYHVDFPYPGLKTAVYYINTCDGYTEFETGDKTESVANRMLVFDSNMRHRGTSTSNNPIRIVMNINYFQGGT